MGAVEEAVDAAADFIVPFLSRSITTTKGEPTQGRREGQQDGEVLVEEALLHLQSIHDTDKAKDPDAPYDGSLVGVVYGLIDLITWLSILPSLSPGAAFEKRPQPTLKSDYLSRHTPALSIFPTVVERLVFILQQDGTGIQPLLVQRSLPDIISAVAELSFSPQYGTRSMQFIPAYHKILESTATSRLLPILTSFVQQQNPPLPLWLRSRLAKELALVPLRTCGIRHTIEFMSLSYLSKNSQVLPEQGGSLSQIPIPLDAVTQTSRLLGSIPIGMSSDEWFKRLAPQLWDMVDGKQGKELGRAAGQIIAGILNRKTTGAPGTIGWELFAAPLIRAIKPEKNTVPLPRPSTSDKIIVNEQDLKLALKRLSVMVTSYSHPGLTKRLLTPLLLPVWGLLCYAKSRPGLGAEWVDFTRTILLRYMNIGCDPKHIDTIATNLFWDGQPWYTYGPGSQGGVEIRQRISDGDGRADMAAIVQQVGGSEDRANLLVALLLEADVDDEVAGAILINAMRRSLFRSVPQEPSAALTQENDINAMVAYSNATLSMAITRKFEEKFARSPQHIIELMGQLLQTFVDAHRDKSKKLAGSHQISRASLKDIVKSNGRGIPAEETDTESEQLTTFALSILGTVAGSSDFRADSNTTALLEKIVPSLQYLSRPHQLEISPQITNATKELLITFQPTNTKTSSEDPQARHRTILKTALTNLTSLEPPVRTESLAILRQLIEDPATLPLIDIPSTTHLLLSASIADPESYVHLAAIPVLVDLAIRASNPTIRIVIDAFTDIDERSLRLNKEQEITRALDFRLRVGEVLHNFVSEDQFWADYTNTLAQHNALKVISEATLSVASRRGQRHKTLSNLTEMAVREQRMQEEGERAWDGPIPNLFDTESENQMERQEHDALLKVVNGWQDTGFEEDVRIRTSALSILGDLLENRLGMLSQSTVDAALQMAIMILTMETGIEKGILRRAAVLVIMGLLRGMDWTLEEKKDGVGLGVKQSEEVDRVLKWVRSEDKDGLVKDHADSVLESLQNWHMKKLYNISGGQVRLGTNLGLEGNMRGLDISPMADVDTSDGKRLIVEEFE